ncbi:MAG: hypothetical protein QXL94_08475 [Candidatus Parvarchaeum sp.]
MTAVQKRLKDLKIIKLMEETLNKKRNITNKLDELLVKDYKRRRGD